VNQHRASKVGLLLVAALAFGAACRGGASQPTQTTLSSPETRATATVPPGTTGIAELNPVIDALRSGDPAAVRQLIEFTELPCIGPVPGPEYGPLCEANEADGELVDVYFDLVCDETYLRPRQAEELAARLASSTLYAVYRVPPDYGFADASYADLGFPPEYVAVLSSAAPGFPDAGLETVIHHGRIIADHWSCTDHVRDFVQLRGLTDAVLPPQKP